MIQGLEGGQYATGCIAMCYNLPDVLDGSCGGVGCCQTSIPRGIKNYDVNVGSYFNHSYVLDFNPCSYAFVVEESTFNFSKSGLYKHNFSDTRFPVVIDWAIGNETCPAKHICQNNSQCIDSQSHPEDGTAAGYRCRCSPGYKGNPYLPLGCQDIDECTDSKPHNCTHFCHNKEGSYTCSCRKGYKQQGDGKGPEGCTRMGDQLLWAKVTAGASIGVTTLLICSTWLYWLFQKRKDMKLREKCFRLNGGFLLQDHLSKYQGSKPKIFSAEALEKATNNYNTNNILGR